MLPSQTLNKSTQEIRLDNSPRGSPSEEQQTKPLSHRLDQSLTSGQLMTSLSGGFIALGMKELKDELRLTKKSEQMVKEKLQEAKKQLDVQDEAHNKYKQEAESRIETLKTENRMLQLSLKHMHEQSEAMERSSTQSNNQDAFRIVEEYSKQIELKSREIEELLISAANKKVKYQQLKKINADLDLRLNRLQSKLDNMSKFCRIFIKSTKLQNQSLRDTVEQQHKDFSLVFKNCKQDIYDQIQTKFNQTRLNYEQLLSIEREHVSNLKEQLSKNDDQITEKVRQTAANTQNQLQKEIEILSQKNTKLRQKLATQKITQSDADEQANAHQIDVLNLQIQSLKQKYELQLAEKDNQTQVLKETVHQLQQRESSLSQKLESVDSKSRQEYQKLVEMYEGSSRFKEIRELYDEKLTQRDHMLLEAREELVKCQVRLEVANQSIDNFKQRELKFKQKAVEAEKSLQELKTSEQAAQQALQAELTQVKTEHKIQMQQFMMNSAKEFEEEIQKSKQLIETQQEGLIQSLKSELSTSKQAQKALQLKVNELTEVLTITREAMQTINSQIKTEEARKESDLKAERARQSQLVEKLQHQNQEQTNKIAALFASEQSLNLAIKELEKAKKEESMALNWELEDLRQQLTAAKKANPTEHPLIAKKSANKDTQTEIAQSKDVSVEAIIINSSMMESHFQLQTERLPTQTRLNNFEETQLDSVSQQKAQLVAQRQPDQKLADQTPVAQPQQKTLPNQNADQLPQKSRQSINPIESTTVMQKNPQTQKTPPPAEESKTVEVKLVTKGNTTPQTEEAQPSRLYTIISSFMSILSRRKQAFTGKPASAMYYCKEKNRWIIQGEEESEDEAPPPPPPKAKPQNPKPDENIESKPEPKKAEVTGLNSLTQPVFGGALANRNRAKKPVTIQPKPQSAFPVPIEPSELVEQKETQAISEPKQEDLIKQMEHTNDETEVNMTTYTARDYLSQSVLQDQQLNSEIETLRQRENELERKCSGQNDKIASLRSQIQNLQDALQSEKKMSQQTIIELESFTNEMQEAGQQHQRQLNEVTEALYQCRAQISVLEATSWLAEDNFRQTEQELQETKLEFRNLKQKYFQLELQQQMIEIQRQMQADEQIIKPQTVSQQAYDKLEDQCETLKWQVSLAQQSTVRAEDQCENIKLENARLTQLIQQLKSEQRDLIQRLKESNDKNSRDREHAKESQQKLAQEKEVLQELVKKTTSEMQSLARRFENEKQAQQQEFLKLAHNKDLAYQQKIEAFEIQKNEEIQAIQAQLEAQTNHLQSQARHEQGRIKKQIHSLESVLSKKDEDLQIFIGKNEEALQEIQSMNEMRQKLNDHIVYLQNEIRKRDELLEDGSDFEDDQELVDDSCYSVGHTSSSQLGQASTPKRRPPKTTGSKHLEEARNQIKALINQKVDLAKDVSVLNQQLRNQGAALDQLLYLLEVDQDGKSINEVVQVAIAKFFKMRNDYESKQMELQHQIDQLVLQVDNTESLNFEIELLTSERDMLHKELTDLYFQAQQLQISLEETTKSFEQQINHRESEAIQSEEMYKRQIIQQEKSQEKLKEELQSQIAELRQKLVKKDDLIGQLEAHSRSLQVDQEQYLIQNQELQNKLSSANKLREENANRLEVHIEELQKAKSDTESQLQATKLQNQAFAKQIEDLEESLQEKNQLLGQADQRLQQLNQEFENVAQAFLQKKESYKQTIQKLKTQSVQNDSQEVTQLKAQLSQADQLIQQMQNETESIVKKIQEKKLQREQKLKEKIDELYQSNLVLSTEIEQIRAKSSLNETQQSQKMRSELEESQQQIQELRTQILTFKQAYQLQQEKHEVELGELQQQKNELEQENNLARAKLIESEENLKLVQNEMEAISKNQTISANQNNQLRLQREEFEKQVNNLKEQIATADERIKLVEEQYQSESQKLAETFKLKQQQQREKTQQLKQEMRNLISHCQDLEQKLSTASQESEALRTELKHIQEEKLNLSQSLDLTRIQTNKEISQMQAERKMFESETEQQLKRITEIVTSIISMLQPDAVVVDPAQQALDLIQEWFKNAEEDKRSVHRLAQEKDELQEEVDGLMYKIQILVQERNEIQNQLSLSENANLAKMVKNLEEERSELRRDFVIKMDSMSQEMSILQDKIALYEGSKPAQSPQKEVKSLSNQANYKLDSDQQTKTTTAKNTSFLASLFLTNSDLSK